MLARAGGARGEPIRSRLANWSRPLPCVPPGELTQMATSNAAGNSSDTAALNAALNSATAGAWEKVPAQQRPQVVVGFDGFVDHIIQVVDTREGPDAYTAMPTIAAWGAKVSAAAGKSANFELVVTTSKIGGNGPIMANALCSSDHRVTCIGLLGETGIDAVFAPLAERAEAVVSLGGPGVTDALEFSDGKVMLGKLTPLARVTYENIVARVGADRLRTLLHQADAIATVNWTMSLGLTDIWNRLADDILVGLKRRPLWFVDLADPAKRTLTDQKAAFAALTKLQSRVDVVLGMNEAELRQVLHALGESWPAGATEYDQARAGCVIVRDRLGLAFAMCHLVKSAACAWSAGAGRHGDASAGSACADGFFDPKPKITTGAGDHFNAGFVGALLAGLLPQQALQVGGATSGVYVRTAVSPTRTAAVAFLRERA